MYLFGSNFVKVTQEILKKDQRRSLHPLHVSYFIIWVVIIIFTNSDWQVWKLIWTPIEIIEKKRKDESAASLNTILLHERLLLGAIVRVDEKREKIILMKLFWLRAQGGENQHTSYIFIYEMAFNCDKMEKLWYNTSLIFISWNGL